MQVLASYHAAHELEPANAGAVLNLADGLNYAGRGVEANQLYEEVVSLLDPSEQALAWQQETIRAQALAHLGRSREAVAGVQRALQAEPRNPQVALEAAVVYAVVGDETSALVNAERSLDLGLGAHWYDLPQFDGLRRSPALRGLLERGGD